MAPPGETRVAIPEISASIGWPAPGFGARRAGLCRVVSVRFAVATLLGRVSKATKPPEAVLATSSSRANFRRQSS
jgi:hypothetical protein